MARTPNTLAPFQFMTLPPCSSILLSSSSLSGCESNKKNILLKCVKIQILGDLHCCSTPKYTLFPSMTKLLLRKNVCKIPLHISIRTDINS